jgi:hypothetical protein
VAQIESAFGRRRLGHATAAEDALGDGHCDKPQSADGLPRLGGARRFEQLPTVYGGPLDVF